MGTIPTAIADAEGPVHVPALDGLRALAILLVIPHNGNVFSDSPPWLWPLALVAHMGWLGVHLFFVLSGFLITRNLIASRTAPNYLRAFYARRALRILPLYFLTLLVVILALPAIIEYDPGAIATHRNQIWLWTFLINWVQPFGIEVQGFPHFWSLAVEEQFYLLWPFVILACIGRRLLWVCACLVMAAFLSRVLLLRAEVTPMAIYMFTICRMDALVIGAVAAVLASSTWWMEKMRAHSRVVMLVSIGFLTLTAAISHEYSVYDIGTLTVGYPMLACSFALIVLLLNLDASVPTVRALNSVLTLPVLRSIGRYSYAMYVFHIPIILLSGATIRQLFSFAGSSMPLFYVLTITIFSYCAGFLSFHLLEKHFLNMKRWFSPTLVASSTDTR